RRWLPRPSRGSTSSAGATTRPRPHRTSCPRSALAGRLECPSAPGTSSASIGRRKLLDSFAPISGKPGNESTQMAKQDSLPPHPWLTAALEWGKRNNSWFSVRYGSLEWESWRDYFEGIGYMPGLFRSMNWDGAWTAPAQWASQLDMELPPFPFV